MSQLINWVCPDCTSHNTDSLDSAALLCWKCGGMFAWDDAEGYHNCLCCYAGQPGNEPSYCSHCMDYERKLQDDWAEFMRIAGSEDVIPIDFMHWGAGTPRNKIWDWFEDTSPRGIHYVMYPNGDEAD